MTDRATLLSYADTLAARAPGSWWLDSEIAYVMGEKSGPRYSSSIDAAMILVPREIRGDNYAMTLLIGTRMPCRVEILWSLTCKVSGEHASLPMALVIACVRAKAELMGEGE